MNEELKYIVNELNQTFNKEYNLISFDSLVQAELLQVLCDVLTHLNAAPEIQVNKNLEYSVVSILDALKSIKYVPTEQITPAQFREGIAVGKRSVVHPILYWLLTNRDEVLKRSYLAKYIQRIDIPPEVLQDEEIQNAYLQYLKRIDEFKVAYGSNQTEMKAAKEATEMSQDIVKMESDIKKINQRIEKQKEKVKIIPNREALMVNIKNYRNEIIQNKKLENQVKEHKNVQKQMEQKIKSLHEKLAQERSKQQTQVDPIKQIMEELQINKILMDSQLPHELNKANKKFVLYSLVTNESEPTQEDIQILNNEVNKLSTKVKTLLEKKMTVTVTRDDRLGPFKSQANKIANKKQQLSDTVMNLKMQIEEANAKMNEKQTVLHSLVGGPILHGEELKQYITKLRSLNVVYKEKRAALQSLNTELGVLNRTLDILKFLDSSLEEALELNQENKFESSLIKDFDSSRDVKYKCRSLAKEINKSLIESAQLFETLSTLRQNTQLLNNKLAKTKEEFDQSTGFITTEYNEIESRITNLEKIIKESEEKYQILHHEIEKNKNTLKLLNENDENTESLKDQMSKQYNDLLRNKDKLEVELKLKEKNLEENKEQVVILNEILNILKCKEKLINKT